MATKTVNQIMLERKLKVIVANYVAEGNDNYPTKQQVATINKNIESLGFTFSKEVIEALINTNVMDLPKFQSEIVSILRKMVGANVKFRPMYPNFPTQVMEMSDVELYLNAIIHYIDSIALMTPDPWLPEYPVEKRPKLKKGESLKVIRLGSYEEFDTIFKNLFNAKVSFSPSDKEDIEWFFNKEKFSFSMLPEKIANKENLAYIFGCMKEHDLLNSDTISKMVNTATDTLRLITAFSGGDVSLASNSKYKKFSRADRKLFLTALENAANIEEDMLKYKNKWIRVGEILHPGEYAERFPKAYTAFTKLRENEKISTFNGNVEKYFLGPNKTNLTKLLSTRPGEFARRLDRVLRSFDQPDSIIKAFAEVADKVSTTVLLQVREHFLNRWDRKYRVFMPKGNLSKAMLVENNLLSIPKSVCNKVVNVCDKALINSFSNLPKMGNVYIDETLKGCPIPFALRSASKTLRTVSRGTKIPLDKDGKVVKFFMHWKNIPAGGSHKNNDNWYYSNEDLEYDDHSSRVDIDLHAAFFDEDFNMKEHISYYNLRSATYQACHSGDITSAPKGASEFIDVNIASALKYGARYLVMNVASFTGQKFSDIPECFAGAMIRKDLNSGEIYEPKTVISKFDLTSETTSCVPIIFDLQEMTMIWCDMGISMDSITYNSYCGYGNNLHSQFTAIQAIGKAFTDIPKPNLYDLFTLHAKARKAKIVDDKAKANTVFSFNEGDVTPYDIDKIISEFL